MIAYAESKKNRTLLDFEDKEKAEGKEDEVEQ